LKRGFGPAAVGTSGSPYGRGAWEVGGGPSLCLPPGRGAGLSLKTPLNTPPLATAAELRWTGGGRIRRGAGGNRRAFGCWRRCLGTRAPLWSRGSCASPPRRRRTAEYETHQVCKDRCVPFGNWPNPRRRRR